MKVNGNPDWTETEAGQQLQERLSSEKTLKALDHLLQRIDTLEQGVERLNTLLESGPGIVSMAVDTVDEGYRRAAERGVDIEQRLSGALALAEKLTAPEMMDKLNSLLKLADQAPGIASMVADMADEGYRTAAARGIDIDQRLGATLELVEKLTAPGMIEQLKGLLKLAEQAPGIMAMGVDILDEGYRQTAGNGIDLSALSRQGVKVTKRVVNLVDSEEFDALLQSDLFNPKTLDVLSVVSGALTQCRMDPPHRAGIFKLLGAVRDPEIQKSLGFLLSFARNFGKLCNEVVERDLQNNKKQ